MEETVLQYKKLGPKTLSVIIIKRSIILISILSILLILLVLQRSIPSLTGSPGLINLEKTFNSILAVAAIVVVIAFIFIALIVWLEYSHYSIFIDSQDIKITRGILDIEEIGIPHRRIEEIKIERNFFDQVFGVSNLVITVLGMPEEGSTSNKSTVVLPYIDIQIATNIQNFVLAKSEVEDVDIQQQANLKEANIRKSV